MLKILLVDDDEIERKGIQFLLKKNNISSQVTEANNGLEAIKLIKKNYYQLIVTDIKMPLIDGVNLVKQVRDFNKDVKILIISGYDDFEYAKSLLPYGVEDYLIKPINYDQFIHIVKEIEEKSTKIPSVSGGPNDKKLIKDVITILNNEFQNDLTLENVANRVFISPNYLSTKFKETVGDTFIHYLTVVRMEHACYLISNSNMKISQISEYVGISNVSYFNRIFKSTYGKTPIEFRNEEK